MSACVDVSIEFSHLYADQSVGHAQRHALGLMRSERRALLEQGKRVAAVILLDDIHVSRNCMTVDDVTACMRTLGEQVDTVVPESALRVAAKRFITTVPKERLVYEPFRRAAKRILFAQTAIGRVALGAITERPFEPTCALLVATWHLARLGRFAVPGVPSAERVISIIEERYRVVEHKALELISLSRYAADRERISHHFYNTEEIYAG